MPVQDKGSLEERVRRYSAERYFLAITDIAYLAVLLFAFVRSGLSVSLAVFLQALDLAPKFLSSVYPSGDFFLMPLYVLSISVGYYMLSFPLNFYRSYILERKFSLSKQKLSDWLMDQVKSAFIGFIISLILIRAFYFVLKHYPVHWWVVISLFWIILSLILAKLTPTLIIPLFFKYRKLTDEALRERILNLAQKMKVRILDVFEIDFSKKTLKANAAFVGVGKTRRVILADTLKDKYTHDEIEVILAHEFAHYKLRHLLKLILVNSAVTLLIFYIIFKTNRLVLDAFGLANLSDLAALPVVLIYFVLFGLFMQPLEAFMSRFMEKNADKLALKITGDKDAFISMMEKLAAQNLADRKPHPLIKFFFFDHPPIDERINMAKNTQEGRQV